MIGLLLAALLLGAFGLRSANLLAFSRADLGTELLAQRTATLGTLPSIERLLRLARDVGINDGSARDPTGSHSLSIALERDAQWPYAWYFREFPDLTVVAPGTARLRTGRGRMLRRAGRGWKWTVPLVRRVRARATAAPAAGRSPCPARASGRPPDGARSG